MSLVPRRLKTRLILLLLAAVALAQVFTYLLLAGERRFALVAARTDALVERTVELVELLETVPEEHWPALLAAASARDLVFFLDSRDIARVYGGDAEPTVRTALARRLRLSPDEVSVRLLDPARLARTPPPASSLADPLEAPPFDPTADDPVAALLFGTDPVRLVEPGWVDAHRLLDRARHALLISLPLDRDGLRLDAVLAFERLPALFALHGIAQAAAVGVAVALVAWFALSRLTRPLAALARTADDLGRGRPTAPLPERGPLELRRLVAAFNRMQERLERLLRDRAQVLAAIGHDLRTPLTGLRLRAELVEDEETRQRLLAGLDEIEATVEAALAFLRAETPQEPVRPTDLAALLESLVDDLADRGGAITLERAPPVVVPVRATALRRALRNLLDNALRYGGCARVRLEVEPREVRILIEDQGPGIPEDSLERVFEPFVRLETSRSRATGGSGLGLAIARTIARAHGGDVRLANRPEGGLVAILTLPR